MIKSRLKIAHVIPDLDLNITGGVGVCLRTLVQGLDRDRTENMIVTFKSNQSDRRFFEEMEIPVFSCLDCSDLEFEPSLQMIEWLMQTFRAIRPDIVHTNLFWGDTLGRQAAYRAKVPVIVMTENNQDLRETPRQRAIKRKLANFTDRIICVSEAVRSYVKAFDGIPDDRLSVIYYGIPLRNYEINDWKQSREFVFVGRIEPQKAPLRLIDAFSEIATVHSDSTLSVIGDGSLLRECHERVEALGLTEKVRFWGYQPSPWECATSGSIFVMTSEYEGQPLVVLEAMATGHLCILPDIPGIAEIAQTEKTAPIYKAGDHDSLVAAMRQVLAMPIDQQLQMIQAARARVERDFDAQNMTEQLLNLYQTLYAQKKQREL